MRQVPTIALLFLTLVPGLSAQKSPAPSLKETEDWIINTLEHGNGEVGYGYFAEEYPDRKDNTYFTSRVAFNACEMKITTHTTGGGVGKHSDLIDTMNLKDLDPHTIVVLPAAKKYGGMACPLEGDCDEATVAVSTRDSKSLIHSELDSIKDSHEQATILVTDVSYAKRLTHALARAIELCGGKPSAF